MNLLQNGGADLSHSRLNYIEELNYRKSKTPMITRFMIYIYIVISFYEPYINGTLGSITKYYIFVLMGVAIFTAKSFVIKKYHICFIVWLVYKIATLFWTPTFEIFKLHFVSQVGMVALLIVLTAIPIDGKTMDGMFKTMWLSSSSLAVLSLFFSKPYQDDIENRLVITLFGQQADPNNQAAMVVIGIALSLYFLIIEKKYKLFSVATLMLCAYSILLTASRGGLISMIAVALCFMLLRDRQEISKATIKKIIFVGGAAVVLFLVVSAFLPTDIYERLFDLGSYEGGSERTVLWHNAWELYSKGLHPIFGAGWGAYFGYNGYYNAVHNTFLAMLCDVGIIGFSVFFIPILYAAIKLVRQKDVLPVSLLIGAMLSSFFIDANNKRFFWNAIIIVFIACNYWAKRKRESYRVANNF